MSEIISRPKVQSVSSTLLSDAAAGGAVLAAGLIAVTLRSLSAAARDAYRLYSESKETPIKSLKPISTLREEMKVRAQEFKGVLSQHKITPTEAIQVATLATLSESPLYVESKDSVLQPLKALQCATSLEAAQQSQRQLYRAIESDHARLFTKALTLACTKAAERAGFPAVETVSAPAGTVRLIASDPCGRALVTEIRNGQDHEPSIETEVVGVTDGSCAAILDAFDKALEEAGVRAAPPKRKFTGGVCELAAAREFLRKTVRPGQSEKVKAAATQKENNIQRRHRLNQGNQHKQNQKG